MTTTVRAAQAAGDAARLCAIYNHYVAETVVTFEEDPVSLDDMRRRVEEVQQHLFWLVCEADGEVVGYAYAGKWKARAAYRFAVEVSVYVDPTRCGEGIGKQLYTALLNQLRETRTHSVVGGIAGVNPASVALHESFGFRKVAHLPEMGHKFGQWIDVAYFHLLL
jgi:L-amino acid N-acyltransferase YncA